MKIVKRSAKPKAKSAEANGRMQLTEHAGDGGRIEMCEMHVDKLVPTDWNPNSMTEDKFNALYENMVEVGIIEPIVCRPIDEDDPDTKYEVIGGHHRLEVAKLAGFDVVPCCIKYGMTDDDVKFQNMRLNVIHGSINAEKFTKMYEELAQKFDPEELPQMLGITSQSELEAMVISVREGLPDELKPAFDKSKEQVKTVEDLVLVLNELFARHKETVEKYHYMILDFDGNESVWIRMGKDGMVAFKNLEAEALAQEKTVDSVIRELFVEFMNRQGDQLIIDIVSRADDAAEVMEDEILDS